MKVNKHLLTRIYASVIVGLFPFSFTLCIWSSCVEWMTWHSLCVYICKHIYVLTDLKNEIWYANLNKMWTQFGVILCLFKIYLKYCVMLRKTVLLLLCCMCSLEHYNVRLARPVHKLHMTKQLKVNFLSTILWWFSNSVQLQWNSAISAIIPWKWLI